MRVAFLVNDLELSGGIGVVVQHARQLVSHHDIDATLVLVREQEGSTWSYESLAHVPVRTLSEAREVDWDVVVSTWWETAFSLMELRARRRVSFVQSLEDRFYRSDEADRHGAAHVLGLPVSFITEARWIQQTLGQLRPHAPCHLVRNGIDKRVFASPPEPPVRTDGPLRILIEGNPQAWFKHVDDALLAAADMREPHHVTLVCGQRGQTLEHLADRVLGPLSQPEMATAYRDSDVILKLSSVEGMFGPPLEAFHMGATCVTTPVTGHEEYIEHAFNALVCDWDDLSGTARLLDLLSRDRALLHELRWNALATARAWPSWEQSGRFMAAALHAIARRPEPDPDEGVQMWMRELRASIEAHRYHLDERREFARQAAPVQRLKARPAVARLNRARHGRTGRLALRLLRALGRRARSARSG